MPSLKPDEERRPFFDREALLDVPRLGAELVHEQRLLLQRPPLVGRTLGHPEAVAPVRVPELVVRILRPRLHAVDARPRSVS